MTREQQIVRFRAMNRLTDETFVVSEEEINSGDFDHAEPPIEQAILPANTNFLTPEGQQKLKEALGKPYIMQVISESGFIDDLAGSALVYQTTVK